MPHREPIEKLRAELHQALRFRSSNQAQPWGNPRAMHDILASIKRDLGGEADTRPQQDQVKMFLLQFQKNGELTSFNSLKYVCYGITVPIGLKQWRVIDNKNLFNILINEVEKRESQAKQFRRSYQGLLDGYFSFDRQNHGSDSTQTNWAALRAFLSNNLTPVLQAAKTRGEVPPWLKTLVDHKNLLGNDPCSRYADGFMRDDIQEFRSVCSTLGISSNSWVWEDAIMAYVQSVCKSPEKIFKKRLDSLLELVKADSKLDMRLPEIYATQVVGMVVSRYCECKGKPEHTELRGACLHWIGNPWLRRTAWDAVVRNEAARQMVESWLKRELIKNFFELLAQDGAADLRRLKYWLKWESAISDMWFVLGADAKNNRSNEFIELRKLMAGRDRYLIDGSPANNAFIMRIGQLLVIEFGVTGNACFVFPTSEFRADLEKRNLSLGELKQKSGSHFSIKITHQGAWEFRFDQRLRDLLRSVPFSLGELRPGT